MRALLVLAAVALAVVVAMLIRDGSGTREPRTAQPALEIPPAERETPPAPIGSIAQRVRTMRQSPDVQKVLAAYVADCVGRGEAAVAELAELLRHEPDIALAPRWVYEEGRLEGYPTLRSAYLAALAGIEGPLARDALIEALDLTASMDEAYFVARALHRRGETGWTDAALEQAGRPTEARFQRAQEQLVTLAAQADPAETAAQIVARAPRGNDGADPRILAVGLGVMSLEHAVGATQQLLADPVVTRKAKERYLRSITDRVEPEAIAGLAEMVRHGDWELEMRLSMAYAAAGSAAFYNDRKAWELAAAKGGGAESRARFRQRLLEVEEFVATALADLPGGDPRRASVARLLEQQRERLP